MKKNLRYFMTLLLMMVASVGWAEDAYYTLAPANGSNNSYTGNCDITISGITWNLSGNSQQIPWRLGGKSLSNVDRTVYSKTAMGSAISKVELTVGAASSITVNSLKLTVASDAAFANEIDEVTATFAANSTITFTPTTGTEWATGAYYKFTFNVTVSGSSNKFVEFSSAKFFKTSSGDTPSKTDIATLTSITPTTLRVGNTGDFTLNASFADGVTEGTDYSVNWASDNTTVLTLNGNAYEAKAVGTANVTVTVSVTDDETYNEVSKSFEVEVKAAADPNQIFNESFDNCKGTGGNGDSWSGTIATTEFDNTMADNSGWDINNGYVANKCIKLGASKKKGSATTPTIAFKNGSTYTITFKAAAWDGDSERTTLNLSTNAGKLDKESFTMVKGQWTDYSVVLTASGEGEIKFEANADNNNRFFLDEINIKEVATFTIAEACTDGENNYFGTFYTDKAYVMPVGVTGQTVAVNAGKLVVNENAYPAGSVVPAETPLLMKTTAPGEKTAELTTKKGSPATNNMLKGTLTADEVTTGGDKYYRLTMHKGETLGFYWGADNGGAFKPGANKAYLAVPATAAKEGFAFGETTGINNVNAVENTNEKIFNLAGQQMKSAVKGVYIKNGRKYVK